MPGFYNKLDCGLTDSTIWQAPDATRLVWITLLSLADQHGYVGASIPGLAARARVELAACVEALEQLRAPDEYSRTKDHDGRRIADADGGWILLNHGKYRALQSAEDRRERSRVAMALLRERRKLTVNFREPELTKLTQAEAEAEALKVKRVSTPRASAPVAADDFLGDSNLETLNGRAVVLIASGFELPESWGKDAELLGWKPAQILKEAEKFRQYWTVGKGAGKRRNVKGWRQSWSNWMAKAEAR